MHILALRILGGRLHPLSRSAAKDPSGLGDPRECLRSLTAAAVAALVLVTVPLRRANAQWEDIGAAAAMSVATGLDLSSTFSCRNASRCAEANPIAAPFYDIRRPGYLIAADAVGVAAITYIGRALRRSNDRTLRRWWWVPAAAFTVGSLVVWRGNVRQLARCPECRRAP